MAVELCFFDCLTCFSFQQRLKHFKILHIILDKYKERRCLSMSNRERIIELLDIIPDYKIGYVLAYVQGVAADEEADDLFCQRMVENYENAPDEDKEEIPLEECLKEWGLD
ncbi:MAG: hypothetical protein NC489_33705 [Ruminococcus flavefaciens]|nr:hypothetical protein [Ruminococcus flavefaciens]